MTLSDVHAALAAGGSVGELTKSVLAGIARAETGAERLNAFISYDVDTAMHAAAELDHAAPHDLRLAGVPVAVKDNLCTVDYPTTCASRMLAGFRASYDATVVRRLRAAGAVVVGKTNLDEFAMGATTEYSAYGRTRHPLDASRVSGGSSGGSAAAVAAGLVPVALGSDTGGSVRQPAAFCGVVGFKPTYGRISRYGLVAHVSSLDTVGIIANSVRDAGEVFGVIAGPDARDATTRAVNPDPPAPADLRDIVVGIPREYFPANLHAGVRERCEHAIDRMRRQGADIRTVEMPHTRYAVPAYHALSTAEASSNLARYDGVRFGVRAPAAASMAAVYDLTRTAGFGAEVKRRILLGVHLLTEDGRVTLRGAHQASRLIAGDFDRVFASGIQLLFTPTTATPAFTAGEAADPYDLYLADAFTAATNLAGLPAISVPVGASDGLPVGGQFIAPRWADASLFGAGAALQELLT